MGKDCASQLTSFHKYLQCYMTYTVFLCLKSMKTQPKISCLRMFYSERFISSVLYDKLYLAVLYITIHQNQIKCKPSHHVLQWKVRRTLAFSIHELAVILGEEITHRDLVPVFDGFMKDLDEVRIGILRHLADFLRVSILS